MKENRLFNIYGYTGGNYSGNVYDKEKIAPTLNTMCGGNKQPMVLCEPEIGIVESHVACGINEKKSNGGTQYYQQDSKLGFRIRKLTECECFKLMGVKAEDFKRIRVNASKSLCYHMAGDSIVTTCLMAIFGEMLGIDYESKIKELQEELKTK